MKSRNFRVKTEDWNKFKKVCSQNDKKASEVLREFVEKVNKYNNIDYIFPQTSIYDFIDE